jgi:putative transposase
MTSVLMSLLATLRGIVRSRAALHLEVIALRHQVQMLQRSKPRRLRLASCGQVALGVVVTRLARLANGPRHREAGDRRRLAPPGISALLGLEKSSTRRTATHLVRGARTDSKDDPRESLWGAPRIHGELVKLGVQVSQSTAVRRCVEDVRGSRRRVARL